MSLLSSMIGGKDPMKEGLEEEIESPEAGGAMSRYMDQNPEFLVHQGISHLDDEKLPIDAKTRIDLLTPLLEAKHFGYGGQQGPKIGLGPQKNQTQGQIQMPNAEGASLGNVVGAVSTGIKAGKAVAGGIGKLAALL